MHKPHIVSIIIPTFNRLDRLRRCVESIRHYVTLSRETIIVDGGSDDGTRDWLTRQSDVRALLEERREGAVKAFNKGFRAATGCYVMWLNDDAWLLPGSVEAAVATIERPDLTDVGMVAFYHNWRQDRNILDEVVHQGRVFRLCHVRGYPYANFGLIRRSLLARIGYADERFHFFGFDPDLSLKVQIDQGLTVIGCPRALVAHEELHDERKINDLPLGREDNTRLFAKWNLPPPGGYPDPAPAYRKMMVKRAIVC